MSETLRARGALDGASRIDGAELGITVLRPGDIVNLRGRGEDLAATVAACCGVRPPRPNGVTSSAETILYGLGPDEWLAVTMTQGRSDLHDRLRAALAGHPAAVTAVGAGQVMLELTGAQSVALLARGCPLDLHREAFAPGDCAQTRLGQATVLLHRLEEVPGFRLFVRRSMASYLWRWLATVQARLELGCEPRGPSVTG